MGGRRHEPARPGAPVLRIESSAFALDLYASYLRYYYDGGPSDWLVGTQPAGDGWDSVGDWFEPGSPSAHSAYVSEVQAHLAAHQDWPWSAPLGRLDRRRGGSRPRRRSRL